MSGNDRLENANPHIFAKTTERQVTLEEEDDEVVDEFDAREIFGEEKVFLKYCTLKWIAVDHSRRAHCLTSYYFP